MADLLGAFEQAILLAIVRLGEDAYGRTILHEAQSSLDRAVAAGAVYTTLDRLEQRGMVDSKVGEGTPVRGGRPRRFYSLTGKGVRALNEAREALTRMWGTIQWPARTAR
jgi:PadR family transcriptional regulator, regulatory protein PadR